MINTAAERLATFNLVKYFLICHLVVDKEIFNTSPISFCYNTLHQKLRPHIL